MKKHSQAEHCRGLITVSFAGCEMITGASVTHLAKQCPGLESVSLWGCFEVGDAAAITLARSCPKLRKLDLGAVSVTDSLAGFGDFGIWGTVPAMYCSIGSVIRTSGLQIENRGNLVKESENIQCPELTDAVLVAVAKQCTALEAISCSGR